MKAIHKNILREIQKTKSRFLSILAIIALSTGFFTGVKTAGPSMMKTGLHYFETNNLMDLRLLSSVGFDDDDIRAIKALDTTVDVMPGYAHDLLITENNIDSVVKVFSLPEKTAFNSRLINQTRLVKGRLPQNDGECVMEDYNFNVMHHQLGDVVRFNPQNGGKPTTDTIRHLEYTVVGVVTSPMYITYQRGNTNKGSGSIAYYIMIPADEFVPERYTNVFVTTTAGQTDVSPYSETYKKTIEQQIKSYETLSEQRIAAFNETTLKDARTKLGDAKREYADKKKEAQDALRDGEQKLHDGERELQEKLLEGEQKLSDGEKELEKGRQELTRSQEEYSKGIEEAKNKLTAAEQQYADGKQQYTASKHLYDTEMEKAQNELDAAQNEFDMQYSLFYGTTKPQAETKLTLLKSAIDLCRQTITRTEDSIQELEKYVTPEGDTAKRLEELQSRLTEYQQKLDDYQKQYDEGQQQLRDGEEQLNAAKEQLNDARLLFQTKKTEASDQLNVAQMQLDQAQSQLEIGKLEYNTALTSGAMQLQAAQSKVNDAQQKLTEGRQELETQKAAGMLMLKQAREKLQTGKAEAHTQLNEAEQKLSDAEDTLQTLSDAKWLIYDRADNPGYAGLEEDSVRVDNIATVFPVFFLLVSALVCLTTMSRMVEERRTEIGTLKALGYSNLRIAAKYFIYAASASVLGSLIGTVIGIATLPYIILDTYSIMYSLPETILVIAWDSFFFSAGTGLLCTCTVAVVTCLGELKINPAPLMRPKSPKPGKRILLEYMTPLWNRMKFTSKVTARNLFRYKARFFMTVVGVAGCTALIIGGLGLKDSIGVIADRQFKEITIYNEIFALSEPGTAKEKAFLLSQFHKDDRFKEAMLASQEWISVPYEDNKHIELRTLVGENPEQFGKMFILRDRQTHRKVTLEENGVVINERLSQVIGKGVGDMIEFELNDATYHCKITDLTENYAGNYMYMTPSFYHQLTGSEIRYNLVYTQLTETALPDERQIANEWILHDDIVTVSLLKEQLDAITSTLDSLNVIVFVLIFCAGMLAMVVLYNLTNINIAERVREIATIKVLGFYNLETANYIYRENMILTLAGALVGLPLGQVFTTFIVKEIQMDMVMFPQYVNLFSFVIGFILTFLFALLVNFIMYFKMNRISMVESLKSIE